LGEAAEFTIEYCVHPQGAHDDVANLVAGVAHCAVNRHTVTVTALGV
jgi:hypothetical protein